MSSWLVRPADDFDWMMPTVGFRGVACPYCRVIGRLVGRCVGFLGRDVVDGLLLVLVRSFPAPSVVPLLDLTLSSMPIPHVPLAACLCRA